MGVASQSRGWSALAMTAPYLVLVPIIVQAEISSVTEYLLYILYGCNTQAGGRFLTSHAG